MLVTAVAIAAIGWSGERTATLDGEGCPVVPPQPAGLYDIEIGYGKGRESSALDDARAAARRTLRDRACAGVSEARCARAERHIQPWEAHYDPVTRSACALAVVKRDVLHGRDADLVALDGAMADLAGTVAKRAGPTSLFLDVPRYADGCAAGQVGAALAAQLERELGALGGVRLVKDPDRASATVALSVTAGAAERVEVGARYHEAGREDAEALGGPVFPADLFGLTPAELAPCRPDSALGIDGRRPGRDGMQVILAVPSRNGVVCEGVDYRAHVTVSAPARVQVVSVMRDGESLLVWPNQGASDVVQETVELVLSSVALPELGDEKLVAIAVPLGASLGRTDGWSGTSCRLPEPFTAPPDAAVDTATFTVLGLGIGGCEGGSEAVRDRMRRGLADLPVCR